MAELLYRLGALSARRAWIVITAWLLLLMTTVALMVGANAKLSTALSVSGIPSQQVIDQLKTSFPEVSRGSGEVVFHTTTNKPFTVDQAAQITKTLSGLQKLKSVAGALNPFTSQKQIDLQRASLINAHNQIASTLTQLNSAQVNLDKNKALMAAKDVTAQQTRINTALNILSQQAHDLADGQQILAASKNFSLISKDGKTALATIYFVKPLDHLEKSQIQAATDAISKAKIAGVEVEFSKSLVQSLDGLLGTGEIIGLAIAGLVLIIMLGTLVGAGLPLLAAVLGVGVSATITMALASILPMDSTTPVLGVMLGLAVGIDYSLFILNRHRRQLKAGLSVRESIALANGTSGNAVLFAGLTVVIALVALNLTGIGFLGLMGTMGAVSILFAVAIALTFTPAVISLLGTKVLSRKERRAIETLPAADSAEQLHARDESNRQSTKPLWVTKRPWIALGFAVVVLATLAIPAASIRVGLPDGGSEPVDSTAYKSYHLISDAFGAGANGQIATVVTVGSKLEVGKSLDLQAGVATTFMKLKHVSAAVPVAVSQDGRTYLFQIVPTAGPASVETENLVRDLRALAPSILSDYHGVLGVTGITASNIDVSKKLNDALPLYLGTVILLSMLLLILVFRSIAVPLIASIGFLLTVFATLGAVVAVHQWGWFGSLFDIHNPGPVLSFLPTMLIGILFGLAMDYQLFLVSGMREAYSHLSSARVSVVKGLRLGRSVVIAAAIIMITVFGGFAFSHLTAMRPIGFGLAVGVLIDAFLVRMVLVPAFMTLLGDKAWWLPKWLDRVLPDVDVEGAKLERNHI